MERYFEFLRKSPNAEMTLFCFPHAGGTRDLYKDWKDIIDSRFDICVLNLPGRGKKTLEAPFNNMINLIDTIKLDIQQMLDKPFIFFGHSMGGLVCYELAKTIEKELKKLPNHIYVSSYPAPHLLNKNLIQDDISDDNLIDKLKTLNGTPKEILANNKFAKILLPIIRADFKVLNSYEFISSNRLNCQITAIIGTNDNLDIEQARAWSKHTFLSFSLKTFVGDHFYLNSENVKLQLGKLINENLVS